MPNWCGNSVQITFPHPDIKQRFMERFFAFDAEYNDRREKDYFNRGLLRVIKRKTYCFNGLVPVPQEVLDIGYDKAGYYWQADNWGTKWDIYLSKNDIHETPTEISFHADTAWAPPIEFFEKVVKMYPTIEVNMKYDEPGMAFVGEFIYDPISQETVNETYEAPSIEYYDHIAEEYGDLDEYFGFEEQEEITIKCSHCNAIVNERIYDAYNSTCYSCKDIILLPVMTRVK